ncbi:hypothetical protein LZC95_46325 [Pendulispora brunnea]|uniref:Adhesin domain-containing protein n=1 Tax=Pendulispora brunnea TaxID=2905690 RepID=A0ABZ2K9S3_9BACT
MRKKSTAKSLGVATSPHTLPLGLKHTIELVPQGGGAQLRVVNAASGRNDLEIDIVVTDAGPTVRVRARTIELDATDEVAVHCKNFTVDAREAIALRAGSDMNIAASALEMKAHVGNVTVRANDDVQLLGEQVLLNCDREPPIPPWVPVRTGPEQLLAREDQTGDVELLNALLSNEPLQPS